jgi:uncharacterized protein (TIGR00730 family)
MHKKHPHVAPEQKLVCIPLTREEIEADLRKRSNRLRTIEEEIDKGMQFIRKYPQSVTFYGSARFTEDNPHYKEARTLGGKLAYEGYAIVTGGGPGIMEAGNRGAKEAGGISLGLNIKLPHEQSTNPYTTESMEFFYFFTRKATMSFSSEAYLFFPGGFGTLDELFEILTLVQTKKIRPVPIILVGKDFWTPLDAYIREHLMLRHGTVEETELAIYHILDDHDEIVRIVKSTPIRC